ncbi:MAG: hypothetical protein DME13_29285 [Candidatus Rokuibacteriota bacterium]|nr:MAG: hypothetical protein DME13_29285 [Candidatus Rokubacteria bacterium]
MDRGHVARGQPDRNRGRAAAGASCVWRGDPVPSVGQGTRPSILRSGNQVGHQPLAEDRAANRAAGQDEVAAAGLGIGGNTSDPCAETAPLLRGDGVLWRTPLDRSGVSDRTRWRGSAARDVRVAASHLLRDFGTAVARLHLIDLGYFAEDLASSKREEGWRSVVESRLERLKTDHLQAGLLPRPSLESASEAILSAVRRVSCEIRPAVVHRDLYLPNTLVAAGRFRCLLDFEHARSTDPLSDFVKLAMWVFEKFPGSESEFRSGYGSDPLMTKDGGMRYRVAMGLELLSGLVYWKTTGREAPAWRR